MEIQREKELVNQYHYDVRNFDWEKENEAPETNVEVSFHLLEKDEKEEKTSLVAIVQFMIVFDDFVISGGISQINHISGKVVNEPSELSSQEVNELATPLLDLLQRLTYEVTEIALDQPGINLEF